MENPLLAFIDLPAQQNQIRSALEAQVHRVFHHGQYILGPEIAELEAVLAEYVGVKHCITVASGTVSLEIEDAARGRIGARYTEHLQAVCYSNGLSNGTKRFGSRVGRKAARKAALSMIQRTGLDDATIADVTELSIDEVQQLRNTPTHH
jgi:hypothetical protein